MKQRYFIFLTVLLTLFIACTAEKRPTPTPFAEDGAVEQTPEPATSLAISITDLAADPEAFANRVVEITGRYQRLPLLICETDAQPAPATWQLQAEDGSIIDVGGFDSQLRSLLPDDLTLTVRGVWQLFEGPVGCGKNAATTQIWYLQVSDILSPSPISQVTLTPIGNASQIAEVGDATAVTPTTNEEPNPSLTATPIEGGGISESTPTNANTTATEPANSTPTLTAVTPTGSSGGGGSSTATATTTNGGGGSTATPTFTASATAGSGTVTPTSSSGGGGNATPTPAILTTATRNPNDFDNIEFDDLTSEVPVLELLGAEEAHLWPISFKYDGVVTVTAVSEPTVDLVLEILDPADDVVRQANSGGDGALETIAGTQLNVALDYRIRIYNLNGTQGDYCLIFNEEGGFPDKIRGRIAYGETVQDQIEVLAIDYYCFLGAEGEDVNISIVETGSSGDFVLGLFGPPDFEGIGNVFTSADIMNAILDEDGMYIIGVLNLEADAAGYMLTLDKN